MLTNHDKPKQPNGPIKTHRHASSMGKVVCQCLFSKTVFGLFRGICLCTQTGSFGFFSWIFKSKDILGNKSLFQEFTNCSWFSENPNRPLFAPLVIFLSLCKKKKTNLNLNVTKVLGDDITTETASVSQLQFNPKFVRPFRSSEWIFMKINPWLPLKLEANTCKKCRAKENGCE